MIGATGKPLLRSDLSVKRTVGFLVLDDWRSFTCINRAKLFG